VSGAELLAELEAGRLRAAWPDPAAPDGWRIDPGVKTAILDLFRQPDTRDWDVGGLLRFRDRASLPTRASVDGVRVVPGGTSIRAGAFLGPEVVIMPPSFVNVGVFIGAGTMVDSHVLVGSCTQVGEWVHLAAGVQVGGVLEPPGARPVIVEDECFIGAGCGLFEGVLVKRGAVLAAGVILTGTSRLYDPEEERVLPGTPEAPLVVPSGSVVVPGSRALSGGFAVEHGLAVTTAIIAKRRDARTAARVALEEALR
jgi:2,3,4,5-tetrahydropyridine-2-carboxylate N-succinyltransferase